MAILDAEVEISISGSGVWFGRQTISTGQAQVRVGPVEIDVLYDIRVRFIKPSGHVTAWTVKTNVLATINGAVWAVGELIEWVAGSTIKWS